MKFCSKCGNKLDDEDVFCFKCGVKSKSVINNSESSSEHNIENNSIKSENDKHNYSGIDNRNVNTIKAENRTKEKNDFSTNDIPQFRPPRENIDIPIFTSPNRVHIGTMCNYHKNRSAVLKCESCGTPMCRECADIFECVYESGERKNTCYECFRKEVLEDSSIARDNFKYIFKKFKRMKIGFAVGFLLVFGAFMALGVEAMPRLGYMHVIFVSLVYALLAGVIGSVYGTYFKESLKLNLRMYSRAIKYAVVGDTMGMCSLMLRGIYESAVFSVKIYYTAYTRRKNYLQYIKETNERLISNSILLEYLDDYIEYIKSQNILDNNIDIDLDNNEYARAVYNKGKSFADEMLHDCIIKIAENGEIIRDFAM